MNLRLAVTAAVAVILTSVSLYPVVQGSAWFWAGAGAVVTVMLAGIATRAPRRQAAVAGPALTLIAVAPLLTGSWPVMVLGLAIGAVVVAAHSWPRLRALHALATLITYLAALLIYLDILLAAGRSFVGVIPSGSSVAHLRSLVSQGLAARALAPPVPASPGIILLTAGGIGLIAMVTDLLAVRLRSPAVAGLPLLALYCVRVATSAQQGGIGSALVFCLGLIGYLALLGADGRERLRIWGRIVTVWNAGSVDKADTSGLAAAGRRVGLAAACAALVLPLLVPGIGLHDLLPTEGSGTGLSFSPHGTIKLPNPVVQMRNQLLDSSAQPVLTYTTTAANPPEQYLQVYVLNYNGPAGSWTLAPFGSPAQVSAKPLPQPPGLVAATRVTRPKTEISLSQSVTGYESKLAFLPVPYAPSAVQVSPGTWLEDKATLMVYSGDGRMGGLRYTVTSTEPNPSSAQLAQPAAYPAAIANNYLSFPAGSHGELTALAKQITDGASTPYAKALKLQSYFTSGDFSYNVNISLPGNVAGLEEFLFTTKAGYCQQFAFAMAALARLAGIPSRIAVGYTAGSRVGKNTWKVTTADAHAWPELYFTGVGWLRFEPTPAGADGQGTATVPQYAPAPSAPGGTAQPSAGAGSGAGLPGVFGLGGLKNLPGSAGRAGGIVTQRGHSLLPWILGVAVFLVLVLMAPLAARQVVRRRRARHRRGAALAHAAWSELRDSLSDYGIACRASESPRAVARRITALLELDPAARQAAARIAAAEERALYAPRTPGTPDTLRADTVAVRRGLARQAGWAARCRAFLLPPSILRPVREAMAHALDVFGWMDLAGLRLHRAIRQQPQ